MAKSANTDTEITTKDMLEAINRSGYLLESQISEWLIASGFFVVPNQVIKDSLTGKSREIDLLAERFLDGGDNKVAAVIKFVFEIKNNPFPMVLATNSPYIDSYGGLKEYISPKIESSISIENTFYELLISEKKENIFNQYFSFKRKKDGANNSELMAWHPDDFHEGLIKIVQHCDEELEFFTNKSDDNYLRDFLFMPVLLLGGQLLELTIKKGKPKFKNVKMSKLMYNYHRNDENKSAIIWVVTKDGLSDFISEMSKTEERVKQNIL